MLTIFNLYSRRSNSEKNREEETVFSSVKLDDLLVLELLSAGRAVLLGKTDEASVAGSMAALKSAFAAFLLVVAFQADVASRSLVFLRV